MRFDNALLFGAEMGLPATVATREIEVAI